MQRTGVAVRRKSKRDSEMLLVGLVSGLFETFTGDLLVKVARPLRESGGGWNTFLDLIVKETVGAYRRKSHA